MLAKNEGQNLAVLFNTLVMRYIGQVSIFLLPFPVELKEHSINVYSAFICFSVLQLAMLHSCLLPTDSQYSMSPVMYQHLDNTTPHLSG